MSIAMAGGSSLPSIKFKPELEVRKLKSLSLFTVPNVLNAHECDAFIKYAEGLGFSHQGSRGPAKGEAYRDNDRISVQNRELADCIWMSGLSQVFDNVKVGGKSAIGLNPNVRFYRYNEGQRFGPHIDENAYVDGRLRTEYTLLVYLNGTGNNNKRNKTGNETASQLKGGQTVFYMSRRGDSVEVAPEMGMALLHLHGEKCLLHEARAVSKGVKYVLRSDVIFA